MDQVPGLSAQRGGARSWAQEADDQLRWGCDGVGGVAERSEGNVRLVWCGGGSMQMPHQAGNRPGGSSGRQPGTAARSARSETHLAVDQDQNSDSQFAVSILHLDKWHPKPTCGYHKASCGDGHASHLHAQGGQGRSSRHGTSAIAVQGWREAPSGRSTLPASPRNSSTRRRITRAPVWRCGRRTARRARVGSAASGSAAGAQPAPPAA